LGKVDAFNVAGLELWFNSEDHGPQHFHAGRPGEWEIRVFFLTSIRGRLEYERKWGKVPRSNFLRAIEEGVVEKRETRLEEWNEKVCQ
jgi:hypothetical protein